MNDAQAINLIRGRRELHADLLSQAQAGQNANNSSKFRQQMEMLLEINKRLEAAGCFENRELYDAA